MFRLSVALVVGVVLTQTVVAAPIPVDEKQHVKLTPVPEVGQVTVETQFSKMVANLKTPGLDDKLGGPEIRIKTLEYERTILKVEDKKVVKFTHKYTKAVLEDRKGKREASYLKRTITFERKDGSWTATADDGPAINAEELAELKREVERPFEDMFVVVMESGKPVKAGESWNLDGKKLAEAFNIDKSSQIEDTSKGTVKLLKAFKKDNQQWGTLEGNYELILKSTKDITYLPGSEMKLKATVEGPIDNSAGVGTVKLAGTLKMKASFDSGGERRLAYEADMEIEMETTRVAKKK